MAISTAEQLRTVASQLPTEEQIQAYTPVEIKGYMNIVNLSDWLNKHGIIIKSEKSYQNGRIDLLDTCPFSTANMNGAYAIQFANGAIHAGCHHLSCDDGKQRWQELREKYEINEKPQKNLKSRWNEGMRVREWRRAG